jgi:hypothetical protein
VQDALVARKVLEVENIRRYKAPFVMEGGAFHVDGEGTLIVSPVWLCYTLAQLGCHQPRLLLVPRRCIWRRFAHVG